MTPVTRLVAHRDFDRVLFACALCLVAASILMTYSAGRTSADPMPRLHLKQFLWGAIGLAGLLAALSIPYRSFDALAYPVYGLGLLLALLVLLLHGTPFVRERWLLLGPVQFQPSEVAKYGVILVLARTLSAIKGGRFKVSHLLLPIGFTVLPFVLILKEPDLGSALVLAGILLPVLYWGGVPVRVLFYLVSPLFAVIASLEPLAFIAYLAALGAFLAFGKERNIAVLVVVVVANVGAGLARPVLWSHLKPYQRERFLSFVNPDDALGSAYQIIQSKVAIGSGGLAGKGLLKGTQKGLSFLPEQQTDFIFSVIGEEFGFVGCVIVLALFGALLVRAILIASHARNRFGSLLVMGIVALIAFQVVVNVGMTLGLLPVTGIPLPLVSYGGTSLTTTLFGIGLVLNVGLHRRDY